MQKDLLLSFCIPCYNSAAYMDVCIESILAAAHDEYLDRIQIIIVDDGSQKDATPHKADAWAERYSCIEVCHQQNGGHGAALLAGLGRAKGLYFKVVDSDDWLCSQSLKKILEFLKSQEINNLPDLIVSNYVYEHMESQTSHAVRYTREFPEEQLVSWEDVRSFRPYENLLMHALMYKTELLKSARLPLPKHTFYVDNIYAYVPLAEVKTLYYFNLDLYRYLIGREDQSVNEKVMISRLDQQMRVTRIMTESFHLYEEIKSERLRSYLLNYLTIMYAICSVFSKLSGDPDALPQMREQWLHLKSYDKRMYKRVRYGIIGLSLNLPGRMGSRLSLELYKFAKQRFKFN